MSTSPSIPILPPPGKDPPSCSTSPQGSTPPHHTPPPTIQTPTHSHVQTSQILPPKPARPSPLRQITTELIPPLKTSNLPSQTAHQTDPDQETETQRQFTPFFTLIHDPSTNTTHHPSRIHYLFSDDDASDLLSSACIRSLNQDQDEAGDRCRTSAHASKESLPKVTSSSTSSSSSATFRKPHHSRELKGKGKEVERREERVLIVDVAETGEGMSIKSASSLSQNWQILSTSINPAPTWDGADTENAGAGEGGLMLRIEGVSITQEEEGEGLGIAGGELGEEQLQGLLDGFERKMGVLRRIVEAGDVARIQAEAEAEALEGGQEISEAIKRSEERPAEGEVAVEGKTYIEEGKVLVQEEGKVFIDEAGEG